MSAAPSRPVFRATVGAAMLVGLGILVLVNWLGARHYRRFDWTRSGLYTLSEKTLNVLKGLKAPVEITVFMSQQNSPVYSETQELLRRYQAASPLVKVETLDPTRNLARAQALVKEYGVREGAVVFRSGEKKKYVTLDQLVEYDFSRAEMGGVPSMKAFKGEQEFTSAILTVTESKTPGVLFVTGHGERAYDDRGREGYYALAETLRRDNCTVGTWASLGASAVPAGTDCLVVAGPRTSFTEPERNVLLKYLRDGGNALLFLDVEFLPGNAHLSDFGLQPLLGALGLHLDDDIVVDPKNALPLMGADTVFARSFRPHPVTKLLTGSAVVFPLARSISVVDKPPAGWGPTVLVETSADGWGETDLKDIERKIEKDDKDIKGPVPLAVAVESQPATPEAEKETAPARTSRIVAFGDADFASDSGIQNAANLYLLASAANWVMERPSLVAIPPKSTDQISVTLSRGDIMQILVVVLLVLPAAGVALGLGVWMRRRA